MATITDRKDETMNSAIRIISFDSDCGRYSVSLKGETWFLVHKETGELNRLSEDMEEALQIAETFIRS